MAASEGPEIVIGLAAPIGANTRAISQTVELSLKTVSYQTREIRLSRLLREVENAPWPQLEEKPEDARYRTHMDAGNVLREATGRADALAMLAIGAIRELRREQSNDEDSHPIPRCAYLLGSLKNPDEVATLRKVYGPAFILIGAYSPRRIRLENLARRIAESKNQFQHRDCLPLAEELLARDESEQENQFGQNVRDVFHQADCFIDATVPDEMRASTKRIVELAFGNTFRTPTKDEYVMFHAQAAALRSASLQRQVGAVIATIDGDIISVGTNEVPKAGGGLYWCDDKPDNRDFVRGYETNDRLKRRMLADLFQRLSDNNWFSAEFKAKDVDELLNLALDSGSRSVLKRAQVTNIIEFGRCVHAEMAAIVDAARRGAAVSGATLYSTTFPCHECARHIVAAGISRVVYIEPYPKSLVPELYLDSIAVDQADSSAGQLPFEPFVGVAPRRYMDLFSMSERKDKKGDVKQWEAAVASPRLCSYPSPHSLAYLPIETDEFGTFAEIMKLKLAGGSSSGSK